MCLPTSLVSVYKHCFSWTHEVTVTFDLSLISINFIFESKWQLVNLQKFPQSRSVTFKRPKTCYVSLTWPWTFKSVNLSLCGHLCHIWKASMEVFLRLHVHKGRKWVCKVTVIFTFGLGPLKSDEFTCESKWMYRYVLNLKRFPEGVPEILRSHGKTCGLWGLRSQWPWALTTKIKSINPWV